MIDRFRVKWSARRTSVRVPRRGGRTLRGRVAFTFVELMIAVAILAIAVAITLPSLGPNDRARLNAAASLIAADLEFAQSVSIATPDDLAVIRFEPDHADGPTYWIAFESTPETPILRPHLEDPYVITFGVGRAAELDGVAYSIRADRLVFDEFGRLKPVEDAAITVSNSAGQRRVTVSGVTGFVRVE